MLDSLRNLLEHVKNAITRKQTELEGKHCERTNFDSIRKADSQFEEILRQEIQEEEERS
jgi:hypothetical protein